MDHLERRAVRVQPEDRAPARGATVVRRAVELPVAALDEPVRYAVDSRELLKCLYRERDGLFAGQDHHTDPNRHCSCDNGEPLRAAIVRHIDTSVGTVPGQVEVNQTTVSRAPLVDTGTLPTSLPSHPEPGAHPLSVDECR